MTATLVLTFVIGIIAGILLLILAMMLIPWPITRYIVMKTPIGKMIHNTAYTTGHDAGMGRNRPGLPFCLFVDNAQPDELLPPDWRWFGIPDSSIGRPITLPLQVGPGRSTPQEALEAYLQLLRPQDVMLIGGTVHHQPNNRVQRLAELETWYRTPGGDFLTTPTLVMLVASKSNLYGYHAVSEKAKKHCRTLGDSGAREIIKEWLLLAGRGDLTGKI